MFCTQILQHSSSYILLFCNETSSLFFSQPGNVRILSLFSSVTWSWILCSVFVWFSSLVWAQGFWFNFLFYRFCVFWVHVWYTMPQEVAPLLLVQLNIIYTAAASCVSVFRVIILLEGKPSAHSEVLNALDQVFIKDIFMYFEKKLPT